MDMLKIITVRFLAWLGFRKSKLKLVRKLAFSDTKLSAFDKKTLHGAADANCAYAQYRLGKHFMLDPNDSVLQTKRGRHFLKRAYANADLEFKQTILEFSAEQNWGEAQYLLAKYYLGINHSLPDIVKLLKEAIRNGVDNAVLLLGKVGSPEIKYNLAIEYFDDPKWKAKSNNWMKQSADSSYLPALLHFANQGDLNAQAKVITECHKLKKFRTSGYWIGRVLKNRRYSEVFDVDTIIDLLITQADFYASVPGMGKRAIVWYWDAFKLGDVKSLGKISRMYLVGKSITQNIEYSVFFAKQCAKQSYGEPFIWIGDFYKFKDTSKAFKYYNLAAEAGEFLPKYKLAESNWLKYDRKDLAQSARKAFKELSELGYQPAIGVTSKIEYNWIDSESNNRVSRILTHATTDELNALYKILGISASSSPKDIVIEACSAGGHSVANFFRGGEGIPYWELLSDVVNKVGIDSDRLSPKSTSLEISRIEDRVVEKLWNDVLKSLPPSELKKLESELKEYVSKNFDESYKSIGVAAGTLAIGGLSGFMPYLMASTLLGSLTSAVGVTLSFGVYTSMSSAISVALGPVGWSVLGAFMVLKAGSPNFKKTLPFVVMVVAIRKRIDYSESSKVS